MLSLNCNPNHCYVVLTNFWSLLLIFTIIVNTTQATQRFERRPEGVYQRLKGQSLDIPCTVRELAGECLWIKNNQGISPITNKYQFARKPSNGDCSIRISDLDPKQDEGDWQCQVPPSYIGDLGLTSENVKVVVLVAPSPPSIKDMSTNQDVRVNADRNNEIECVSQNGNPAPRIEWYLDGENVTINSKANIDTITSDSPKVTSVINYMFKRMHRNSTISCISIHPTVTQTVSAVVNVNYAPQVSLPQKSYTLNEGNTLTVQCLVDSNPITNAEWKTTVDNYQYSTDRRTNSVTIKGVTKAMNGQTFDCSARNEFGISNEEKFTLDVLFEPALKRSSEPSQNVDLGKSLELFCDYEGNPKPKVMWYQINPITEQVRHRPNGDEFLGKLMIQNITYHDEGHYYCEALNHNSIRNKDNIVRSAKITVDIKGKPEIIQKKDTSYGYRGTDTDVEQIFCSDPIPTQVYWQYGSIRVDVKNDGSGNSEKLIPENNISKSLRHKARQLIPIDKHGSWVKPTCFRAILSIVNTDISDQREYTLHVENNIGFAESIIKLKVSSPISAAIMITIGLIVLIMLLALTLVTMLVIKRRKLAKEKADDESKAEARAPIKSDTDKEPGKAKGENHELVYANLDFAKADTKPSAKSTKPQAQQRQHKTNGGGNTSGTEYAQITFTNKADL